MTASNWPALVDSRQWAVLRALQAVLAAIGAYGVLRGSAGVAVNGLGALAVTLLPALLRREYDLPVDLGPVLWLTSAALLHAVGVLGPYRTVGWWDYLTHALSGSVVAGVGYLAVRAVEQNVDGVSLPGSVRPAFVLLFVLATGVLWELVEFGVSTVGHYVGAGSVLTVYGLDDVVTDLVFTGLGGLAAALFGTARVRELSRRVARVVGR